MVIAVMVLPYKDFAHLELGRKRARDSNKKKDLD